MTQRRTSGDGGLYQRSTGAWVGSVDFPPKPTGERDRRYVSSKDRNVAMAKLRKLRRLAETGHTPATHSLTVEQWLDQWITQIAPTRLKPKTLLSYRASIRRQIIPAIGTRRLAKLMPADVRSMRTKILSDGLSTQTARHAHQILSRAMKDAQREGLIEVNVCERVEPPKIVRTQRSTFTAQQASDLLRYLDSQDDWRRARVTLALFTGARQAECLGLEWSRVDLDNAFIDVSWTLQWMPLKPGIPRTATREHYDRSEFAVDDGIEIIPIWRSACLTTTKSRLSRRVIPIPEPVVASLRALRGTSVGDGLVFMRTGGRPLRAIDDREIWSKVVADAGIPALTLHSIRHTLATLLQEDGVPESVRMALMGHSSIAAHRGYAHADTTLAMQAVTRLADSLAMMDDSKSLGAT